MATWPSTRSAHLRYLVGTVLGGTGYVRDRDAEFSRTAVPRSALLTEIEETIEAVGATLDRLSDEDLDRTYPVAEVAPVPITTRVFLIRLAMHTSYHNGQVNYHRRLLAVNKAAARAGEEGPGSRA